MIARNNLLLVMEKALDYSMTRQEIIVDNVANATTPGFKRRDVSFADTLKASQEKALGLKTSKAGHLEGMASRASKKSRNDGLVRVDGNSVDLEIENAEMAANAFYYQTVSKTLGSHFNMLERIISQGGRS